MRFSLRNNLVLGQPQPSALPTHAASGHDEALRAINRVAQGNALGKWWIRVCVRGMGCVCPDDGTTLPRKGIVTANEKFHVVTV